MINYLEPNFSDSPYHRKTLRNYKRDAIVCDHIDVSIITPYYNTEEFFVETVVSLQAQSLQNWEWVIVDDGSTNQESIERLIDIATKDSRIKVIHQANAGPSAARNKSFNNTVGRYVCLLDSDDMIEPTYLEKCVWFLDSNPAFAFCNSYSVVFGEEEYLWTNGFEKGKSVLQENSGPPISVIRRAAYSECGGFDESIRIGHEDWDFWLAMAKAGHWGHTIPEYLQWYRKQSSGRYEQMLRLGNHVNDEFTKTIQQKYAGIDECFPEPSFPHPLPYETITEHSLVCNPLAENPSGRRVMFIVPWMVTGGADRVNLDLIEGLTAKGYEITVCATLQTHHQWEHQFSRFTPDIFILPNFLYISDYPRFLAYLVKSRQIDTVMITGSTIGYHFLPYLRSVCPHVAFVDMSHVEEPHWLNGGHPRFGVGYQDVLDLNIVTTQHLADWMQERGADINRIAVMYTGVRSLPEEKLATTRAQVRTELTIPTDMPVIVFAGRICEQKRPEVLAEILKAIHDSSLDFRALIIGDGEQKNQLVTLLEQYQLTDNVQMLGSVPHQKWLDILVASDILLMPSQYEGISIALLEAMAAGVVPVVSKVGGQEEIVSSNAGILITRDIDELQEYLTTLSILLTDSAKLQQMSEQCKVIATSKLSWDGMIDNFIALLAQAHQLRIEHPRNPISTNFAKELVSLALEYKRLGDVVDFLWKIKYLPEVESVALPIEVDNIALPTTSLKSGKLIHFIVFIRQTWLGNIMVRNRFLKAMGKKILNRTISL